jgi:hypothetical protein
MESNDKWGYIVISIVIAIIAFILYTGKMDTKIPESTYEATTTETPYKKETPDDLYITKKFEINAQPTIGEVNLQFTNWGIGQNWISDRYGEEYHYRASEKDAKYIYADLYVNSQSKDPLLPKIGIFEIKDSIAILINYMNWNFYKWEDYGSYLGNYPDYGNDFAHSNKIAFTIGVQVPQKNLKNTTLIAAAWKQNCTSREVNAYGSPEIKYTLGECGTGRIFNNNLDSWVIVKKWKF